MRFEINCGFFFLITREKDRTIQKDFLKYSEFHVRFDKRKKKKDTRAIE